MFLTSVTVQQQCIEDLLYLNPRHSLNTTAEKNSVELACLSTSGRSCAKTKLCSEKHIGSFNSGNENIWKLAGRRTSKCTNVIT